MSGAAQVDWFAQNAPKPIPGGDWFAQNAPPASPATAIASGASPETIQAATQSQAKQQVAGARMREMAPLESNATAEYFNRGGEPVPGSAAARVAAGAPTDAVEDAGNKIPALAGALSGLSPEGLFAPVTDAIGAYRTARAAKLAKDAGEWQRINGVLDLPKTGVTVSPSATDVADAVKMPGRTVAELGYSANDLQKMDPIVRMNVLDSHLQNAGTAIQNAAQIATKAGKTLDVGDSAMGVFRSIKDPAMQEKMVEQFNSTARELGIGNLRQATPEQALALRQALRAGKTFSGFSDIQTTANISKQLGSAVSNDLKNAVPDFVNLDRQYTDLRGARDAARSQVQMALKKAPPPTTLQKAGRFAVQKILPKVIAYGAGGAGAALGYGLMKDMRGEGQP